MAIEKEITFRGLTVPSAYVRLVNLTVNYHRRELTTRLVAWTTKGDHDISGRELESFDVTLPTSDAEIRRALLALRERVYQLVKDQHPTLGGATDADEDSV